MAHGCSRRAPAPNPGRTQSPAANRLPYLRVAEVADQDVTIENGKVTSYRVKLKVSFKYEGGASPRKKAATSKR